LFDAANAGVAITVDASSAVVIFLIRSPLVLGNLGVGSRNGFGSVVNAPKNASFLAQQSATHENCVSQSAKPAGPAGLFASLTLQSFSQCATWDWPTTRL
jgi:hypothetical protein